MTNNPTSEKLTFIELIKKYTKIEIPIIQRDYAQGREGKEELRENLLSTLLEAVESKEIELDFIYGSVKNNIFYPLDGQQRLTTLFLLHWFIACKENKLEDNEIKEILTKFTYETRTSSREFCEELINKGITYEKGQTISEQIKDNSWFFLSWKKDPTIKAMLTMLDAIEKKFKDTKEIWNKLNRITFQYIELENFGLSDDLYIKMNARGKALTPFENFKANFEQHIKQNGWENNVKPNETFAHKIDTEWTDLFWKYRDKSKNIFDEKLSSFFRTMALLNYVVKDETKSKNFKENVDLIRSKEISFSKYLELGCFDKEYFETIKSVLNKISDKQGLKIFLHDNNPYINEEEIFKSVIESNLGYADLTMVYAYYQYLAQEENIEVENLKNWMRVVRNLVEGSRLYLFNEANEFANALLSIKKILPHRNSIIQYFSDTEENISLSGFIGEQAKEERTKAKLILQDDNWKKEILEIENHGYFKGQIGFLLDWCEDESGIYNIDGFKKYTEKAKAVFSDNGLNIENYLFERALLATDDNGNYMMIKGSNYSFVINSDRDISWKRLLRDNNERRNILKSLLDEINPNSLNEDLEKIINDFSDKNDWRYYFIKYPEMIKSCGSNKFIRYIDENNILLLGSTATSGYHNEYYSYSLFVELEQEYKLTNIQYCHQRSVNEWKYIELNGIQIGFDSEIKKYFWTQDYDWDNKRVYESREMAIREVTKNIS